MDRSLDGHGVKVTSRVRYLLVVPPLAFLAIFYFYPLISIFTLSFAPEGIWNMGKLYQLIRTDYYAGVL